jgi:hypothetical protein
MVLNRQSYPSKTKLFKPALARWLSHDCNAALDRKVQLIYASSANRCAETQTPATTGSQADVAQLVEQLIRNQ